MSKKNKNIILIISSFLLFMFLFEMINCLILNKNEMDNDSFSNIMTIVLVYPVIIFSIIALIVRFNKTLNKKIDKTYRKIIYYIPIYALILPIPIFILVSTFLKIIHII